MGITQCRLVSSYRRFGVACLPPSSWHHSKSFTSTQTLCYFEIWTGRILELLTVRQACSKMFRCVSALPPFYGRTSGTCPRPLCLYALSLSLLSVCMCVCVCVCPWRDTTTLYILLMANIVQQHSLEKIVHFTLWETSWPKSIFRPIIYLYKLCITMISPADRHSNTNPPDSIETFNSWHLTRTESIGNYMCQQPAH